MIDWFGVLANALWVIGLAMILAGGGLAAFFAAQQQTRLRDFLRQPDSVLAASAGLALVCLGLAAAGTRGVWETGLWLVLAFFCAAQAWTAQQQRRGRSPDLRVHLSAWLNSDGPLVVGIIVLSLLLASAYAYVIRPWMQPDEPRHFEVAQHVARLDKPVVFYPDRNLAWEGEIIADMEAQSFWWYGYSLIGWDPNQLPASFDEIWGGQYGLAFFQQPLYYTLAGAVFERLDGRMSLSDAVVRLRLATLTLLLFSLLGVYHTVRMLFPDRRRLALAALLFAGLWPSHLAAAAAVNNDPLVAAFVIWALYFAIRLLRFGPDLRTLTWIVLLGLLAAFTKRSGLNALLFLPLALTLWGMGVILARWASWRQDWRRRVAALAGLALGIAVGLALGVAALRSDRLFLPQDFTAALRSGAYLQELAAAPLDKFAAALLRTFFGWFGWMRVPLPEPCYWLGAGLLALAVVGLFLTPRVEPQNLAAPRRLAGWQKRGLLLLGVVLVVQLGLVFGKEIIYGTWRDGSVPQARYLFPVLPAILLPLLIGWRRWVPVRWRAYALPIGFLLLVVFNVYTLALLLYPFFWL